MKHKFSIQALFLALGLTTLDQISKYYIAAHHTTTSDIPFLQYSENTGIAFGIPMPKVLLIVLTLAFIPLILHLAHKELNSQSRLTLVATALLVGGAVGNLLDRIFRGFVVDFISIGSWPNFNLADVYITTGVLIIILFYARIEGTKKTKNG